LSGRKKKRITAIRFVNFLEIKGFSDPQDLSALATGLILSAYRHCLMLGSAEKKKN